MFPITIKNPAHYKDPSQLYYIPVPCRKCPACLLARTNEWGFKLMQEDKIHERSYFVTLTMTNETMNMVKGTLTKKKDTRYTNITPNGFMSLRKQDLQNFFKRLRKEINGTTKLKYYAVGEYGSKTYRPHYHIILFGATILQIEQAWSLNGKLLGEVTCDPVNGASIAYTAKYINKGKLIPLFKTDDRLPEFQLTSQSMGVNYITPQIVRYHNHDITRNYVTLDGGVKIGLPPSFKRKIYDEETRKKQAKLIQTKILQDEEQDQLAYYQLNGTTDNYYRVRNESKQAAVRVFRERQKSRNKI